MKCKHDNGWCSAKNIHMFIFPSGEITLDFQSRKSKAQKVLFRCNNLDCKAVRNVYISGSKVKFGKIRYE